MKKKKKGFSALVHYIVDDMGHGKKGLQINLCNFWSKVGAIQGAFFILPCVLTIANSFENPRKRFLMDSLILKSYGSNALKKEIYS